MTRICNQFRLVVAVYKFELLIPLSVSATVSCCELCQLVHPSSHPYMCLISERYLFNTLHNNLWLYVVDYCTCISAFKFILAIQQGESTQCYIYMKFGAQCGIQLTIMLNTLPLSLYIYNYSHSVTSPDYHTHR